MKAVVMERRGSDVAILDEEGIVHVIGDKELLIGQEIEMSAEELYDDDMAYRRKKKKENVTGMRLSRMAAGFAAILLLGCSVTAYAAPVSSVTVDAEPSVAYEVNIFDRVVKMKAYNEDGEKVVKSIGKDVRGKKIEKAMEMTFDEITKENNEKTDSVVVTVDSRGRSSDRMKDKIDRVASEKDVPVVTADVTEEMKNNARMNNESPGRKMYDELREKPITQEDHPLVLNEKEDVIEDDKETVPQNNTNEVHTNEGKMSPDPGMSPYPENGKNADPAGSMQENVPDEMKDPYAPDGEKNAPPAEPSDPSGRQGDPRSGSGNPSAGPGYPSGYLGDPDAAPGDAFNGGGNMPYARE